MNQESEQTEKVIRIIALKRFEQPPPGYFHLLPDRIVSRIEQGEGKSDFWDNFAAVFSIRPALVYAFGLSIFGAVTAGILYSPRAELMAGSTGLIPESQWAVSQSGDGADGENVASEGLREANWMGSTSPIMPSESSSMFQSAMDRPMAVSFVELK